MGQCLNTLSRRWHRNKVEPLLVENSSGLSKRNEADGVSSGETSNYVSAGPVAGRPDEVTVDKTPCCSSQSFNTVATVEGVSKVSLDGETSNNKIVQVQSLGVPPRETGDNRKEVEKKVVCGNEVARVERGIGNVDVIMVRPDPKQSSISFQREKAATNGCCGVENPSPKLKGSVSSPTKRKARPSAKRVLVAHRVVGDLLQSFVDASFDEQTIQEDTVLGIPLSKRTENVQMVKFCEGDENKEGSYVRKSKKRLAGNEQDGSREKKKQEKKTTRLETSEGHASREHHGECSSIAVKDKTTPFWALRDIPDGLLKKRGCIAYEIDWVHVKHEMKNIDSEMAALLNLEERKYKTMVVPENVRQRLVGKPRRDVSKAMISEKLENAERRRKQEHRRRSKRHSHEHGQEKVAVGVTANGRRNRKDPSPKCEESGEKKAEVLENFEKVIKRREEFLTKRVEVAQNFGSQKVDVIQEKQKKKAEVRDMEFKKKFQATQDKRERNLKKTVRWQQEQEKRRELTRQRHAQIKRKEEEEGYLDFFGLETYKGGDSDDGESAWT